MFNDSTIHFLRTFQTAIIARWQELGRQQLSPDFVAGQWFRETALQQIYDQVLQAFEHRHYRDLNRTIDSLIRSADTPTPLEVKVLLVCLTSAAFDEFEPREDTLRDGPVIRRDLLEMGRTLKQIYSERLCPRLISVLAEHRDDLRDRWLRDLPTARLSDHFSLLSENDREAFVDQTLEIYEAILRGRDQEHVPHPHDPNLPCTAFDAWVLRQVDYFTPKGFTLVTLLRAVEHLPALLEPLLARATVGDEWTYRVSLVLMADARNMMIHSLSDAYVEKFSKNFYGEVGIMLHRIKNKLTSVPTTMQTVLAVGDEQYGAMFDPMVMTIPEAELLSEYDRLTQAVVTADAALVNGHGGEVKADDPDLAKVRSATAELQGFMADNQDQIDTIKMMKLDVASVEMVTEMLNIVLEGGKQTEELTRDLQLRMNEMYEREPPRREVLPVSELLTAAASEAEVDARAKDINFVVNDQAAGLKILGVRREIGRPFVQVIDNAIKYTPSGGDVTVTLAPDGPDHVVFSCQDTGIGIPPGEEEVVFEMCNRCSNAKDFAGGTGTGLYHDRITVMHHNGEMWIESAGIGQGTTMYIRLPLNKESDQAVTPAGD